MEEILRFFGWFRLIPDEFYTFYSYTVGQQIKKQRPAAPYRTLGLLKRTLGHLLRDRPDAFDESFVPQTPYY